MKTGVPSLTSHKQIADLRCLPFCYVCGREFQVTDQKNKDHIPPKAVFAKSDLNYPLVLPTHRECNSRNKVADEKIGQLISLRHGRYPSRANQRLKIRAVISPTNNGMLGVLENVDIRGQIRRWLCAFHAALYREPLPPNTSFAIQTPFPETRLPPNNFAVEPVHAQHLVAVHTIKTNRAARNIDVIRANNGKFRYECVWDQADDGSWLCIFALDLYQWKDLGDIHNFPGRGCAGIYILSTRNAPVSGTKGTKLEMSVSNRDVLDPFGD